MRPSLERTFLGKGESWQGCAVSALGHFHPHCGSIGGGDFSGAQHRVLREDLAVNLGDEVVSSVVVLTPDLPLLDGLYGHGSFLNFCWITSRVPSGCVAVSCVRG